MNAENIAICNIKKYHVVSLLATSDDKYLVDIEQKLSNKTDSLPVKLFMCSGTIGDVDSMLIVFTDILKKSNYKGFEFKSIELKDFDHIDFMFPTWSKGLRYILYFYL
jgi:hypothetical protein